MNLKVYHIIDYNVDLMLKYNIFLYNVFAYKY